MIHFSLGRCATVLLAAYLLLGAADGPPFISSGGIWNAASRMPSSLQGGAIARGSLFSIRGARLGPYPPERASAPVLELGGTSVLVNGSPIPLLFVASDRILARMPTQTPLGIVSIAVSRGGGSGPEREIRVVDSSPGLFGTHLDTSWELPESMRTLQRQHAAPGEVITLRTTGLEFSNKLTILAGGVKVKRIFESGETLRFEVPRNVPLGCAVPVMVQSGGVWSNVVPVTIETALGNCADKETWMTKASGGHGPSGFVFLLRTALRLEWRGGGQNDHTFDIAMAGFPDGSKPDPNESVALPPAGTCTAYTAVVELGGMFNLPKVEDLNARLIEFNVPFRLPDHRMRYGGLGFTISGSTGSRLVRYEPSREYYMSFLGGTGPGPFSKALKEEPLFLESGTFEVQSLGGGDVGAYGGSFQMPAQLVWENRDSLREVVRSRGATVKWSGAGERLVVVAIASVEPISGTAGMSICVAPQGASQLTVPAEILANLPTTGNSSDGNIPIGGVAVGAFPSQFPAALKGDGIDRGIIFPANFSVRQTVIR